MTVEEIIALLKKELEEIKDINNIPKGIPFEEKTILVQSRQELSVALQHVIDMAESQKSSGKPEKKHELIPE